MARDFDGASLLRVSASYMTCSVSFWFYPTDLAGTAQVLYSEQTPNGANYQRIQLDGSTTTISIEGNGAGIVPSFATVNMNAWNHVFAVLATTGTRLALNGANYANGTKTSGSGSAIRIGAFQASAIPVTYSNYYTGRIAELAIWGGDITSVGSDVHKPWAAKRNPLRCHGGAPSGVTVPQVYCPFWSSSDVDRMRTISWLTTGTPGYADHCPQIYGQGADSLLGYQ